MRRAALTVLTLTTAVSLGATGCSSSSVGSGPKKAGSGTAAQSDSVASSQAATSASSSASRTASAAALPINASGVLAGDAKPTIPAGASGKVDVVVIGPLDKSSAGSTLPVIIRNNSVAGIAHVDLTAVARDSAGKAVATGSSQGFVPAQIKPGEPALGYVYFDSAPLAGATYQFSAETSPADRSPYNTASVKIDEANNTGSSIVGTGSNQTGAKVTGPYSVHVYCFSSTGKLSDEHGDYANENGDLAPGAKISFTADLYGAKCPTFLVGSSGYYD